MKLAVPVLLFGSLALVVAALTAGCGKSAAPGGSSGSNPSTGMATVSAYDAGPRAGEQPIDESRVAAGDELFKTKGCSGCHAFGKRLACPDLDGVTMRRTAQWMQHQILEPEVMTHGDPISHALLAQYSLQMPNQKLTPDEARSVIEFLKHSNHERSEAAGSPAAAAH